MNGYKKLKENKMNQAVEDEYLDDSTRLAFKLKKMETIYQVIEAVDRGEVTVDREQAKAAYDQFLKKLDARQVEAKQVKYERHGHRSMRAVYRVAACIVVLLCALMPFAIANFDEVCAYLRGLKIDFKENHAELQFIQTQNLNVPDGWKGNYYLTYIPEGFELTRISEWFTYVEFENEEGRRIIFDECDESVETSLNTENADVSYVSVGENQVMLIQWEGTITVTWATTDRYFVLQAETTEHEALKIVENVRKNNMKQTSENVTKKREVICLL